MSSFRSRDPFVVGAISLSVVALLLILSFRLDDLPLIGGGTTYRAAFSEAGGLAPGDEVRVAGIRVGKVEQVYLADGHVRVEFKVTEKVRLGRDTRASTQLKTMLGSKFLSLEPAGPGALDPEKEIPLSRTVAAYDVVEAFQDLTKTTEQIDTARLATALDTVATEFQDSREAVRAALDGVSRLSQTLASRDAELRTLMQHARGVTSVLADRTDQLTRLVHDGQTLFAEVIARRQIIHQLLVNTSRVAVQLSALVRENKAAIEPALKHVNTVLATLQKNKANLDRSLQLFAPFARLFTNTVGNGPWFDGTIQNMAPVKVSPETSGGRR